MNISMGKPDSAMLDDRVADEPSLAGNGSAGMILSSARNRLGWDIADVAANLNLRVSVIQALEADDYANLPGPTFVRGYQRSYARLLGVDERQVLATDYLGSMSPRSISGNGPVMRTSILRRGGVGRSRSWILWLGLLVLIVVGWIFSGVELWGPDGLLASLGVGGDGSGQAASEISLPLDPGSRTGTSN